MSTDNEMAGLLIENAERVFSEQCPKEVVNAAEAGTWPTALWTTLEELGFPLAAVPETSGGAGLSLADALPLARIAGKYAVPLPFGETLIAAWLLARAGFDVPAGPLAFGPCDRRVEFTLVREGTGWILNGRLRNVPWGNTVKAIALVCATPEGVCIACVDPAKATATAHTNLAGEPRVHLDFTRAILPAAAVKAAPAGIDGDAAALYGALLRGQQMAGALGTARDLAVRYTGERIAFGKPLNKLQAVQQNLAVLAGQAAAAQVAADMALDALSAAEQGMPSDLDSSIALAKVRIGEAVEIGARLAHQAHGAIGFTYEHTLHHVTRRLWSWRDEFGNEAFWSREVGGRIVDAGPDQLWNFVTRAAQL